MCVGEGAFFHGLALKKNLWPAHLGMPYSSPPKSKAPVIEVTEQYPIIIHIIFLIYTR